MNIKKLSAIILASALMTTTVVTAAAAENSQTESTVDENGYFVIEKNVVTEITDEGKKATKIVIPEGVKEIGCRLNVCENLETLEIPASVTYINSFSFVGCSKLKEVIVSEESKNFSSADGILFEKNKIELVLYPAAKSGTTYTLPESVKTIGVGAFGDCAVLKSIIIHTGISFTGGWISGKVIPTFSANISDIYFTGSKQQWRTISDVENIGLAETTEVHYNYGAAPKPESSSSSSDSSSNAPSSSDTPSSSSDSSSNTPSSSDTPSSSSDSSSNTPSSSYTPSSSSDPTTSSSTDSEANNSSSSDSSDAENSNSGSDNGSTESPDTGFGGIAMSLGIFALAGAAVVVAKKKH